MRLSLNEAKTMLPRKSPTAAQELGISYARLINLMRSGKLAPPKKDSSGDYLWTEADMEAARKALMIDRRKRVAR
jgi:predicted site-specific integrase-resolvase